MEAAGPGISGEPQNGQIRAGCAQGQQGRDSRGSCCPGKLLAGNVITRMTESLLEQQTPPDLLYFYGQIREIGFYLDVRLKLLIVPGLCAAAEPWQRREMPGQLPGYIRLRF